MRKGLSLFPIIPAKAGTQAFSDSLIANSKNPWAPASAGVSGVELEGLSQ
jgi:hypothetical protein